MFKCPKPFIQAQSCILRLMSAGCTLLSGVSHGGSGICVPVLAGLRRGGARGEGEFPRRWSRAWRAAAARRDCKSSSSSVQMSHFSVSLSFPIHCQILFFHSLGCIESLVLLHPTPKTLMIGHSHGTRRPPRYEKRQHEFRLAASPCALTPCQSSALLQARMAAKGNGGELQGKGFWTSACAASNTFRSTNCGRVGMPRRQRWKRN